MRQNKSIDGFVPRRSDVQIHRAHDIASRPATSQGRLNRHVASAKEASSERAIGHTGRFTKTSKGAEGLSRSQIDESLKEIDAPLPQKKKSRRQRRRERLANQSRRRKIIKRVATVLAVLLLAAGVFLGIRAWLAGSNIFQGNLLGVLQQQPLKTDANGRSNIVIFGTAEDSEGGTHEGGNLTDSIMILSVDQKKKDAYMLSIPRDLWVAYDETCTVGNEGKVNAVYLCGSGDGVNESAGAAALQSKLGEITGLDIQYYAHVNFTVVTEAVDAVGGVDVTIETDDPRGILDRNFDWKCNYQCYYVNYQQGERAHLDGEHALALMRARNAQGGYGLAGGNFDRERNQQKILVGLRDKALSAGTLTNIGKVTGLMDALGNNLRTNFEAKEIRTLMSLAQEIGADKITQLSLDNEEELLVVTDNYLGQSIVRPVAGIHNYVDIRSFVRSNLMSTPVTKEKANVAVLNGSSVAGLAARQAETLEEAGFRIGQVGNAPEGSYGPVEVYQLSDDKPATRAELKKRLGVEVKTDVPPSVAIEATDFVIIYGREPGV